LLLLRVVQLNDTDPPCTYIPMSPPQQKLVRHLDHLLRMNPTVEAGAADGEQVSGAVKVLNQSLISIKVAESPLQHPLIAFVGCVKNKRTLNYLSNT